MQFGFFSVSIKGMGMIVNFMVYGLIQFLQRNNGMIVSFRGQ